MKKERSEFPTTEELNRLIDRYVGYYSVFGNAKLAQFPPQKFTENQRENLKQRLFEIIAKDVGIGGLFGAKFSQDYEIAYYEKLRGSKKKREAFGFLRNWLLMRDLISGNLGPPMPEHEAGQLLSEFLARLVIALDKRDSEFFKGLAEALEIVEQRENSSVKTKTKYPWSLRKWLLEYALANEFRPTHTARELNEQFVSKFRSISAKKLREKCGKLNIPLKDDVRGAGAVRRKRS